MDFSLIVPCYNEAKNVNLFFWSASRCFEQSEFTTEIIFVDDGSSDGTLDVIREQIHSYRQQGPSKVSFSIIELSRNFGKESALYAGLDHSSGNYVGFIDADMQQDPQVALEMLRDLVNEPEYDVVAAAQDRRHESLPIRAAKKCFYGIFNHMSDTKLMDGVSDFRVFTRQVADAILSMGEQSRFSKGLFSWIGFRTKVITYEVHDRYSGKSKWSFRKLCSYAWNGVLAFSTLPLKIIMVLGALLAFGSLIMFAVALYHGIKLSDESNVTMLVLNVVLLISGIQMVFLGVLGEYMARGYLESKRRPIYLARREINSPASGKPDDVGQNAKWRPADASTVEEGVWTQLPGWRNVAHVNVTTGKSVMNAAALSDEEASAPSIRS